VLEFKVKFIVDAGVFELDVNTDVVSLYATVESDEAATDKDTDAPAATVPKEPAPVEKVGASDTVNKALLLIPELPVSGLVTIILYEASTVKVKFAVIDVALEYDTLLAV
tara:strand:- start:14 stop:343 length:330 start_codon:yes stop_codon:yes gene_type:complete